MPLDRDAFLDRLKKLIKSVVDLRTDMAPDCPAHTCLEGVERRLREELLATEMNRP